ncbi:hypothetical protein [Endobacterium cereale]|uniref:hypothetical protein n=1 Tax=Endobacterium cereale TaxID=2663029 RepID=UPI002B4787A2|nr:hypothetical protein [Endobacterium cereale]MEB2848079.1 hypothetical protein [Endobacterium cereale]
MDWVPIVLVTFKVFALALAMYYAIKWHYDQGEKAQTLALLRTSGKMVAIFIVALLVVGLIAFSLSAALGLDLSLP